MSIPTKSLEFLLEAWRDHSKTGFHVTFLVSPQDQEFFKACADGQRFAAVLVKLTDQDTPGALPTDADLTRENNKRAARAVKEALTPAEAKAQTSLPIPTKSEHIEEVVSKALTKAEDLEPARRPHFPDGLTGLAVRWCADTHFQSWLQGQYPDAWSTFEAGAVSSEEIAKLVLCEYLGIESRKELNTDVEAERRFRFEIVQPYKEVRKSDGLDQDEAPF